MRLIVVLLVAALIISFLKRSLKTEISYLKSLHISVNDRLALLSKHPDGVVLAKLLGKVRSHGECV